MDWLTQRTENIFGRKGIDCKSLDEIPEIDRQISNPTTAPQPVVLINVGLCINCDNLGRCVWQHNNKINCQQYL